MKSIDLTRFDLNLLVVTDALLADTRRRVSRLNDGNRCSLDIRGEFDAELA